MQQYKEWEYFSFGVKLWANSPISAGKIKNCISHKFVHTEEKELRTRERSDRKIFEVEPSRMSDNALLASRKRSLSSWIPRQKRNQARSHGNCPPGQLDAIFLPPMRIFLQFSFIALSL